ncbi:hypothetical protein SUGI_0104830 [Cryptomeria japonica]|nr:hypothetical protein SUGI_0104830 [Cryptomeria japonica]
MKRTSEEGEIRVSEKRARSEGMSTSNDVDEFFAVLKRIDETEKQFGIMRTVNKGKASSVSLECSPAGCNKQAVMPRSVWRPSFAWEDFCGSGIGSRNENGSLCTAFNESSKRNLPEIVNNDSNCVQRRCLRVDQDYEGSRERLDLNLPLTSTGLHHFL